jgi:hypothetical protein
VLASGNNHGIGAFSFGVPHCLTGIRGVVAD